MNGSKKLLKKFVYNEVEDRLQNNPAVAILGPRQVGKSTLAKEFIIKKYKHIYLDLESPQDLLKISDLYSFLSQCKESMPHFSVNFS